MELLNHTVILFLIFWRISTLFPIVAISVYISTNNTQVFPFLHILANGFYPSLSDDSYSNRHLPREYSGKESACQCRRPWFNPRVSEIPWRNSNPIQYSYLENLMDRGAWQARLDVTEHTHIPTGTRWYLIMISIYTSQMTSNIEHLFLYLWAICVSSLENSLSSPLPIFN